MKQTIYCEYCRRTIKSARFVSLELSNTDSSYYKKLPDNHVSQGAFDFHPHCAIKQLKEAPATALKLRYCEHQNAYYSMLADSLQKDLDTVERPVHVPYRTQEDVEILARAAQILRNRAKDYSEKGMNIARGLALP